MHDLIEKLDSLISNTKNLTKQGWNDIDIQYDVQSELSNLIDYLHTNMTYLKGIKALAIFDVILDYCIGGPLAEEEFVFVFLQKAIPRIKTNVEQQFKKIQ
jgi:hypothetical protein